MTGHASGTHLVPMPFDDPDTGHDDGWSVGRDEERILPSPNDPRAVVRIVVESRFTDPRTLRPTLRRWRGGWWRWLTSHWVEVEDQAVRSALYEFTEHAVFAKGLLATLEPWSPTRHKIANLTDAMAALLHLDERTDQPSWVDDEDRGPVVATSNGLLIVRTRELLEHTPAWWNTTAVPFEYDATAPAPAAWLKFLHDLWPDDPEPIATLQEWFGYVVSGRLDLHKILLLVGPTRGGKGTIARILGKMIGPKNVAGPTLSSLNHDFGMAPLLGKSLAVVSDARLDARRDSSVVVERLLAISGEDTITVNRKYRDQWTGKLPVRFLVISNELPRLGDASGVIANRFVPLLLNRSWLHHEDLELEGRLTAELSGILNWALDGLDGLTARGRFTRPAMSDEAIRALQDLASPVSAFVRDACVVGPSHEAAVDDIYEAWKTWAEGNGHKPGSKQMLGRNLRSVVPMLWNKRTREGEDRQRVYVGIGLRGGGDPNPDHSAEDRGPSRTNRSESTLGPHGSATKRNVAPAPRLTDTIPVACSRCHQSADQADLIIVAGRRLHRDPARCHTTAPLQEYPDER